MKLADAMPAEPARLTYKRGRSPKILTFDIETSPHIVYKWDLNRGEYTALNQVVESSRMLCWAAKWYHSGAVLFASEHHDGTDVMRQKLWDLLNDADVCVTYNGPAFDVKHVRREFRAAGLGPYSPVQHIDLLRVARAEFKFASNKLDWVSQELGVGHKVRHAGMDLWRGCLAGDAKSWATMRKYCIGDVKLTELVYDHLRPWMKNHPHLGLYSHNPNVCQRCGSAELKPRGHYKTPLGLYNQYVCGNPACQSWSRGKTAVLVMQDRAVG